MPEFSHALGMPKKRRGSASMTRRANMTGQKSIDRRLPTRGSDWWKHKRPYGKRVGAKKARRVAKKEIREWA